MLRLDPSQIGEETWELLKAIDRQQRRVMALVNVTTSEAIEAWQQEYAANAAYHGARLDAYMRSIGRE